jgi:hypothetical protein
MAFSYDLNLTNPISRVRHMLGDVTSPGFRSDETITALLADYPENQTTMILADSLASEFAMKPTNMTSPEGSLTWGDRVRSLKELATRLRLEIEEGVVSAAADKLRSFAPVRDETEYLLTEYNRPLFPIFFNREGDFWWD